MNKKLLFAAMSLAAFTACNSDDFESKNVAQQETSPVVFEVLNNNASMRASMDGNKIAWSAEDGDLFTLYHGGALGTIGTSYQNATFKAEASEGASATLTTPSMILEGGAVMVWPVDTTFRASGKIPSLVIPEVLPADVENYIPYVSDEINIAARGDGAKVFNSAGYNRVYPIYMRPMASQLNLKTDYAGTDAMIAQLYEGGSACPEDGGIEPIEVTSVELVANEGGKPLTKEIPLKFTNPGTIDAEITTSDDQWKSVANNAWNYVTDFDKANIAAAGQVEKLTTKSVQGLDGCKFLILPLKVALDGTEKAGIVVNTNYGKVIVASNTDGFTGAQYTDAEIGDAWYRYLTDPATRTGDETATSEKNAKNQTKVTSALKKGLQQTLNGFSGYTATSGIVKHEPIGASATRYVKVLLKYLQINGTHIKTNKQLRDIALIWKYLGIGAGGTTTVYLDGDANKEFEISQKTIKLINDLNAEAEAGTSFAVAPCTEAGEQCQKIVVTGGGDIQNLAFVKINGTATADVVFKAGETWKWNGTVTLATAATTGVKSFINKGDMVNALTEATTLAIYDNATTPVKITAVPLRNEGTWTISGGDLNVQFDVTNIGTVTIGSETDKTAEYHQDGTGNIFVNDAETLEKRFNANGKETIGKVNNHGVFAAVNGGNINNYGVIEHLEESAKTYITTNMYAESDFANPFAKATNKMGRINLPYSNRNEENLSIKNAAANGFVSVTVTSGNGAPANGKLDLSEVGAYVNYCIIKSGVTEITNVAAAIKYVEFDAGNTEIAWNLAAPKTATYDGLIVFSPVNVSRGHNITINNSVYLKAKMYVGGATTDISAKCNGYYGDTSGNYTSMYITY